jgi:hypothetical protein
MGFEAGDQNLYRYVGNRPTNATDPSGLADQPTVNVSVVHLDGIPGRTSVGGIRINAVTTDKRLEDKIRFIQFVQVNAQVNCTYFKTCEGVSFYIKYTHKHGNRTITTSDPKEPYWNLDRQNPEIPYYNHTDIAIPLSELGTRFGYQIEDWPIITKELPGEIEKSKEVQDLIRAMEAAKPNDGKVTCFVSVTAQFQTFIVVDGVIVSKVSWSVGNGYYPKYGNPVNKPMDDKLLAALQSAFPKETITNPKTQK